MLNSSSIINSALLHSETAVQPSLTDIHHVVVHAVNGDHFHEVVVVVSPLGALRQVSVVLEQVVEELQVNVKKS